MAKPAPSDIRTRYTSVYSARELGVKLVSPVVEESTCIQLQGREGELHKEQRKIIKMLGTARLKQACSKVQEGTQHSCVPVP